MSSTDIQPLLDSQPPALPPNVPRVKADGLPTTYLLDWEMFQTNWFKSNIIATDQRIDTVEATADNAAAAVTTEANARVSADEALAEQITTVEAKANNATASGQIYFAAMGAPSGAIAAYGIFLTAGNSYTGMQMIARSGGGSAIAFSANQFALNDSGTAQNVFNYTGGVFTFNVPVRIGTTDILAGAVNAPAAAEAGDIITVGDTGGAWVNLISVTHTGASGYVALIHADIEFKQSPGWSGVVNSANWRVIRSDGYVIYDSQAMNFAVFVAATISRLDTGFNGTYTYSIQAQLSFSASSGTPSYQFRRRGIMIDLRKR